MSDNSATLLQSLQAKFGDIPDEYVAKLAKAKPAQLRLWQARLLANQDLAQIFRRSLCLTIFRTLDEGKILGYVLLAIPSFIFAMTLFAFGNIKPAWSVLLFSILTLIGNASIPDFNEN